MRCAEVEFVERFYRAFDDGAITDALALFADELETVDPGMGTVHGLAPLREYLETLKRAVPDARAEIDEIHGAGNVVVVEGRFDNQLQSLMQNDLAALSDGR